MPKNGSKGCPHINTIDCNLTSTYGWKQVSPILSQYWAVSKRILYTPDVNICFVMSPGQRPSSLVVLLRQNMIEELWPKIYCTLSTFEISLWSYFVTVCVVFCLFTQYLSHSRHSWKGLVDRDWGPCSSQGHPLQCSTHG